MLIQILTILLLKLIKLHTKTILRKEAGNNILIVGVRKEFSVISLEKCADISSNQVYGDDFELIVERIARDNEHKQLYKVLEILDEEDLSNLSIKIFLIVKYILYTFFWFSSVVPIRYIR